MRKLVDSNLIKVIDSMSDTPYEEYKYTNTPMEGFQIAQGGVSKTNKKLEITFEGKIEPYTKLSLTSIDSISNIGPINDDYRIDIHLPEIITEPFEIDGNVFFDNEPTTISFYIYIPEEYAAKGLPLCMASNEERVLIKYFGDTANGTAYIAISKPEGWSSLEEGWAFGYKYGMFYIDMHSL